MSSEPPSDYVSRDPAAGVKRLNPLVPVVGVVAFVLVAGFLLYAVSQRSARNSPPDTAYLSHPSPPNQAVASVNAGLAELLASYDQEAEVISDEKPSEQKAPDFIVVPEEVKSLLLAEDDQKEAMMAYHQRLFLDGLASTTLVAGGSKSIPIPRSPRGTDLSKTFNDLDLQLKQELENHRAAAYESARSASDISGTGQNRPQALIEQASLVAPSKATRTAPPRDYQLEAGTVISALLINAVNTDLPGLMIAQVGRDVRDSRHTEAVLIPAGSRLIGRYDSQVAFGQQRILARWKKLQFPDGSTLELENIPAVDPLGQSGLQARVDNKAFQAIAAAGALSVVAGLAQGSQVAGGSGRSDTADQLAAELGRQWSGVGTDLIKRILDVQPTLKLKPGYPLRILITSPISLPAYTPWTDG